MARQLSPAYRARRPTETVLYRVLKQHLGRFIEEVEAADRPLPQFVRRELEGVLRCGRFEFGFARQACRRCGFERLVGLPCGGRGFCPSCLGRRMVEGAARLVDFIAPAVPVRQWVLSLPVPLRFVLAYDADLCSHVLSVFIREVFRWLQWTAKRELGLASVSDARCGSFTTIHRAGGSLNLNIHFHAGILDGVYVAARGEAHPEFRALPAPARADLLEISQRVYHRTHALFIARGRDWERPEEMDAMDVAEVAQEPLLLDCAQASVRGVGLFGEQAGQPLFPLAREPALLVPADLRDRERTGGFDIQAHRRVSGDDRAGLERLCRYLLHPVLAHDRLSLTADGRVRLRFTRPWKNGLDAVELDPLNFIARLVPLVPAPGTHQLRYHGVLAARSGARQDVVPPRPPDGAQLPLFSRKGKPAKASTPKPQRIAWARLLKRMAGYEMETCPHCGAQLSIVGVVLDPSEIQSALASRGLLAPLPPITNSPSRGPPSPQLELDLGAPEQSDIRETPPAP